MKDITNKKFNKLTAIRFIEHCNNSYDTKWLFQCECGKETITTKNQVTCGSIKSCGCLKRKEHKDIMGKKFGMLTAIKFHHQTKYGRYWLFQCECGKETIKNKYGITNLSIKSCGCLRQKFHKEGRFHYIHGMSKTRFWHIYFAMKTRCNCKKHLAYLNYGGRGIRVEWKTFLDFKNDMYESYLKHFKQYGRTNTTIDRINNDGNYCKANCRWATRKEQSNNMRNNILRQI